MVQVGYVMKSITIHGMDDQLSKKIHEKAKSQGLSLNKTIKRILEQALGIATQGTKDHRDDFIDFLSVWSEEDFKAFESSIQDMKRIDPEDWK